MSLRLALLVSGNYISCIPASTYRYGAQGRPLKALPVDMEVKVPMSVFTLKNRSLRPVVQIFIEQARLVAAEIAKGDGARGPRDPTASNGGRPERAPPHAAMVRASSD
jgi:hypothetical protein